MGQRLAVIGLGMGLVMSLCSCAIEPGPVSQKGEAMFSKKPWGKTPEGQSVDLYTLINAHGLKATITNYGGIVVSLETPDRKGQLKDIVLGYDNLEGYVKNNPYFGCIVGRYGNRIAKGKFVLDGKTCILAANNNENHLHGGVKGFDKVIWTAEPFKNKKGVGVKLAYLSKDGEEGYPGNLLVNVTYTLTDENELEIEYLALTDKATVVNLTHHGYFNLTGGAKRDILAHELMINAKYFTPVDAGLIPTGKRQPVKGTPFDFTKSTAIGARIDATDEQIKFGLGYDHNWVLDASEKQGEGGEEDEEMAHAATLYEPTSGRLMEVWTTEPGIQFYSGNFLDGTITGKGGVVYKQRWALCLETQHYPDSPNHADFPTTILRPGKVYETTTVYKFKTR